MALRMTARGRDLLVAVEAVLQIGGTDDQVWDTVRRHLAMPKATVDECVGYLALVYALSVADKGQGVTREQIKDEVAALMLDAQLTHGKPAEVDN